jgi:hypothetical protein
VRLPALLLGPALLLTACTSGGTEPLSDSGDDPSAGSTARVAVLRSPEQPASVVSGSTPAELAAATSTALYESAPLVLVADESDTAGQEQAAAVAASAGAPLLLTPTSGGTGPVADELVRLDPSSVLAFGQPAADWAEGLDLDAEVEQAPADGSAPDLPGLGEPEPAGSTVVLAVPGVDSAAAQATAQAAGAQVLPVTDPISGPTARSCSDWPSWRPTGCSAWAARSATTSASPTRPRRPVPACSSPVAAS